MADKIIFFDIDGTLLNPITFTFEESTIKMLRHLKDQGFKLGIATGRAYLSTKELGTFDLIDWDIIVVNNGQRVFDYHHNLIFEQFIEPQVVQEFIDKAHQRRIAVLGQGEAWHFWSEINDYVREVHKHLGDLPLPEPFDPSIGINTLMVYGYDFDFVDEIEGLRYVHVKGPYADVMLEAIDKYTGIAKGLEHLGLSEYYAMGDSANDLEMAQHAKLFVATKQASDVLLPYTHYQVQSDYNEIEIGMTWLLEKIKD